MARARARARDYLLVLVAATAIGVAIRYLVIQPPQLGWTCQADGAPWWCPPRQGLILALHAHVLGILSLLAGLAAVVRGSDRWGLTALGLGAAGLWLYGVELSSAGVLLAGLKAVRG